MCSTGKDLKLQLVDVHNAYLLGINPNPSRRVVYLRCFFEEVFVCSGVQSNDIGDDSWNGKCGVIFVKIEGWRVINIVDADKDLSFQGVEGLIVPERNNNCLNWGACGGDFFGPVKGGEKIYSVSNVPRR